MKRFRLFFIRTSLLITLLFSAGELTAKPARTTRASRPPVDLSTKDLELGRLVHFIERTLFAEESYRRNYLAFQEQNERSLSLYYFKQDSEQLKTAEKKAARPPVDQPVTGQQSKQTKLKPRTRDAATPTASTEPGSPLSGSSRITPPPVDQPEDDTQAEPHDNNLDVFSDTDQNSDASLYKKYLEEENNNEPRSLEDILGR